MLGGIERIEMELHVFCIFIYCRGHHRKGVAIYNAALDSLHTTLVSYNKKCIYEHYREFQTIINLLIDINLAMKIFFW
jgi:hypothetical protein